MHLRNTDTVFPEYLRSAGYHTRHVGKSHVGSHKFMDAFGENDSPWDRWSPPWFDDDRYLAYLRTLGLGPLSFERPIVGASTSGSGPGNNYGGWVAPQNGRPFPIEATYPWYLVERAIETLESKPHDDAPFYLQLDFFAPHQPFAIPAGMEEREHEIRASLPQAIGYDEIEANGHAAPWEEPRVYTLYRRNWGLRDRKTVEDYTVANTLQYEVIDRALQRLLDYLLAHGLYESATLRLRSACSTSPRRSVSLPAWSLLPDSTAYRCNRPRPDALVPQAVRSWQRSGATSWRTRASRRCSTRVTVLDTFSRSTCAMSSPSSTGSIPPVRATESSETSSATMSSLRSGWKPFGISTRSSPPTSAGRATTRTGGSSSPSTLEGAGTCRSSSRARRPGRCGSVRSERTRASHCVILRNHAEPCRSMISRYRSYAMRTASSSGL